MYNVIWMIHPLRKQITPIVISNPPTTPTTENAKRTTTSIPFGRLSVGDRSEWREGEVSGGSAEGLPTIQDAVTVDGACELNGLVPRRCENSHTQRAHHFWAIVREIQKSSRYFLNRECFYFSFSLCLALHLFLFCIPLQTLWFAHHVLFILSFSLCLALHLFDCFFFFFFFLYFLFFFFFFFFFNLGTNWWKKTNLFWEAVAGGQ